MCINIRIAILNPQRSEIRPLSLGTHLAGFKHLFQLLREENTNKDQVTGELEVAMEMSQHEFIIKREMTYKLKMTALCSCWD